MNSAQNIKNINNSKSLNDLDDVRVSLLGKKGEITLALKNMGQIPADERREKGQQLNILRGEIERAIAAKKQTLIETAEAEQLSSEKIDVTLPVKSAKKGYIHPITQVIDEISAIFADMGFATRYGPLIEDDFHNFTALNIPESHPARQMHDTFYAREKRQEQGADKNNQKSNYVLRTHTSPVQVRTMMSEEPPIRIIAPGAVFRSDSDLTHTPMFHQIEGLLIDKDINMGHLKGCLIEFLRRFFGVNDLPIRFRPSFFPFTEPSAEVDIGCKKSRESLTIGDGDDWLEILGCGMIHQNVLESCNLDPNIWQGFAFGLGVERLAMLKYNIPDLRTFFDSDQRWLEHYGFAASNIPNAYGVKS